LGGVEFVVRSERIGAGKSLTRIVTNLNNETISEDLLAKKSWTI